MILSVSNLPDFLDISISRICVFSPQVFSPQFLVRINKYVVRMQKFRITTTINNQFYFTNK